MAIIQNLRDQVTERYRSVNGEHPMSADDDAYVTAHFVALDEYACAHGVEPDTLRRLMLAGLLPLPSYLRSDGAQMVPHDLLALAQAAGGVEHLPSWFRRQFDPARAEEEWEAYVSGQYVCLWQVSPATIKRKDELVAGISELLERPAAATVEWRTALHELVDELDALEPPFAPYDRLRFGGPISRDQLIDDVRQRFPRSTDR